MTCDVLKISMNKHLHIMYTNITCHLKGHISGGAVQLACVKVGGGFFCSYIPKPNIDKLMKFSLNQPQKSTVQGQLEIYSNDSSS